MQINKDHPNYEKFYKMWVGQGKPGAILVNGMQYTVQPINDGDVLFLGPQGGIDDHYGATSGGITHVGK
jgi:hypothetical protein